MSLYEFVTWSNLTMFGARNLNMCKVEEIFKEMVNVGDKIELKRDKIAKFFTESPP